MTEPKIIQTIRDLERHMPEPDESEGRRKRRAFDRDKFHEVRDTVIKLVDLTNTMGCEEQVVAGIVEGLVRSHRYLQDKAVQAIFQALAAYGSLSEGQFTDPRNEFAHKLCGLLHERFKDELFWRDE